MSDVAVPQRQENQSVGSASTFKKNSGTFKQQTITDFKGSMFVSPKKGFSQDLTKLKLSDDLCPDDEIIEGFGNYERETKDYYYTGTCFLKTKSDKFKEHFAVLSGNEVFCYRDQQDTKFRVMHSLTGTFIKDLPAEQDPDSDKMFFPVKIVLPPNKSRILYFDSQETQTTWLNKLLNAIEFTNISEFYELTHTLGKGQFGLVKLGTHIKSGKQVAVKTVKKANMKPIEIFQQRREIEVLKMCQHPNIIKLIDIFDSSD